jgi:hypothetical protein
VSTTLQPTARRPQPRPAPERSLAQRMDALRRANDIRTRRAKLKPAVKAGRQDAASLILNPPDYLESMKALDLVLCLPKHGRVKATKALNSSRISPVKTLGGMTQRQREELVRALGGVGNGALEGRGRGGVAGSARSGGGGAGLKRCDGGYEAVGSGRAEL